MDNPLLKALLEYSEHARIQRLVQEMSRQHPKPEHERLRGVLQQMAMAQGYMIAFDLSRETGYRFDPEPNPDVALKNMKGEIFIGDAKDSENERATHQGPRVRVFRYQEAFGQMLNTGGALLGKFMIATNTFEAAQEWVTGLNLGAGFCNIAHVAYARPNYTCWKFDPQTWIVW